MDAFGHVHFFINVMINEMEQVVTSSLHGTCDMSDNTYLGSSQYRGDQKTASFVRADAAVTRQNMSKKTTLPLTTDQQMV